MVYRHPPRLGAVRAVYLYLGPAILVLLGIYWNLITGYGAYLVVGPGSLLVALGAICALAVWLARWSRARYGVVRVRFACPPWLVLAAIGALFIATGFLSPACARAPSPPPSLSPVSPPACLNPEPALGIFVMGLGLFGAFLAFVFTWNPRPRTPVTRPA